MSSYNTVSERALATFSLEMHHGEELEVLVGGLGLGFTASEVLACARVARLHVVEFLPQVIGWLRDGLLPQSDEMLADTRLRVIHGDVYEMLSRPATRLYDVILIDVDHSPDERLDSASAPFYTVDGLRKVRCHLNPGGVLAVWSYAESADFFAALAHVFEKLRVERVTSREAPGVGDANGADTTHWIYLAGA